MTKTDQEMADDYCELIADEIRGLEIILSGDEANRANEFDCETLLDEMASNAGEESDSYQPNAIDWLNVNCLEFVTLGQRGNDGEWTITGWKTLRSFGGPNVWIEGDDSSIVSVDVYWGGSESHQRVFAPTLSYQLDEMTNY